MAEQTETESENGLTALDWVVIVCATIALVLLVVWVQQQRNIQPPTSEG
ncbi:MAG: hypothetical protein ACREQ5_01545 [Candidatus Dormibacteria bacterium]